MNPTVKATCGDFEAALRGDDPALAEAFARHAANCPACREDVEAWDAITAAAPFLRKEWSSPGLEDRIRRSLHAEVRWSRRVAPGAWLSLAAAACLVAALLARSFLSAPSVSAPATADGGVASIDEATERLLTEKALGEVEKAEQAYARSIDALSKLAEPRLRDARSPLLANYREKLLLLDTAITDCRAQAERNRFNAHLRLELLSIYQEKQRTLESLLKEDIHAI